MLPRRMSGSRRGQGEGQGPPVQILNQALGGKQLIGVSQGSGPEEGLDAQSGESAGNGDDDPLSRDSAKVSVGSVPTPKKDMTASRLGPSNWASLFGIKPSGKSSFPPVKVVSEVENGKCSIAIPDEIVDHSVESMATTLIGKFTGQRPNIDVVRDYTKKKWALKGQVSVTAMAKGFLAFDFSCKEDMISILSNGPWRFGRFILVLQKWAPNLDLN